MNKNDLIAQIAENTNLSKSDSSRALEAALVAISEALSNNEEVRLVNFGTFSVVKRKSTTGRNPRTGAVINIPESKQPKFRPGKALKDSVN